MSTTKVGFLDVKASARNVSPELFMDMLAGDRSILGKVFGIPFVCFFIKIVLHKQK